MSIREKIIEFLENNSRKTIKEIAEAIQENEPSVRTKIFDKKYGLLTKGIVAKVSHEKRTGFFSLAKNHTEPIKLLKELHSIMYKKMDFTENPTENEIESIKNIEETIK